LTALPQSWYYETVSQRGRFPEQRRAFIAKKQTHSRSSPAAGPRAYFCVFRSYPWEILPFLKGGSFRVQAGIIGGFLLLGGITNLLHPKNK
jgi:hypothetical protein